MSYQKITAKKTLQSFYELVVLQKEINIRIQLRKKHSYKLNYAISVLSSNNLQTYKLNLAVLTTVIFKKGFSFFK
ncbi:hypothetical protein BKP44_17850 [Formosa algae]|nr:hypothetical protein BKP44_17850 [Formosa algae]